MCTRYSESLALTPYSFAIGVSSALLCSAPRCPFPDRMIFVPVSDRRTTPHQHRSSIATTAVAG